jgi:phosphoglycolate phosphatase
MRQAAELVFDLDGTISDPLVGIHRSINFALTSQGLQEAQQTAVAALIGPPLDDAFRSLVSGLDERQIPALVSKYRERYAQVGFAENTLYEGIAETLVRLSDSGFTLGVCTSKRSDFAEKILELFGIRRHFAFVNGGDVGVRKAQQLEALVDAGLVRTSARMIGDRAVDILAARANGLSSIGVLWDTDPRTNCEQRGLRPWSPT